MDTPHETDHRRELARLRTQNHRLRLALTGLAGVALGAAAMGVGSADDLLAHDTVSITTDGTYVYRLLHNGRIERLDIETREDANKQRPDIYYTRPINDWNLFSFRN